MYYDQYGYPHYTPQEMAQQRGMMPTQPQPQPQAPIQAVPVNQPRFICRPVASQEEARGIPTDFSGNILIMPDFAHRQIYTKALGQDGSSIFDIYRRVEPQPTPVETPAPVVEYAPMSELARLQAEVDALREELAESKRAGQKRPGGKAVE